MSWTLFFWMMTSCISQTESKGIDEIIKYFGGKVVYSIGTRNSSDKNELQGSFFELKLSGIDLKSHFKTLDLPASNCAYLFYHSLGEKEKEKYVYLKVIIEEDKELTKYEFPVKKLKVVENEMRVLNESIKCLKSLNMKKLASLCQPLLLKNGELIKFKQQMIQVDSTYGTLKRFSFQGFKFSNEDDGEKIIEVLRLSGALILEKENLDFSITVNTESKKNNLFGIRFQK